MRKPTADLWSGVAMLAVTVSVCVPSLLGVGATHIPRWLWALIFAIFGAGLLGTVGALSRPVVHRLSYGVAVASAWVLVLTSPVGLVPVLLVVTAAASVYVVPLWCGLVVVALNTVVVALAPPHQGDGFLGAAIPTGFYLLIQLASLLSTTALVSEQRLRTQLTAANVELLTANMLLSESVRTSERLRISRELHDLLGHQLTALTLQLETARHVDGESSAAHIDNANTLARELLRDVRATVTQLRTQAPNLRESLAHIAQGIPGLTVTVNVADDVEVDEPVTMALLRATQEVITNAVKHSRGDAITIDITASDQATQFSARDNGVGATTLVWGNGLTGLKERFAELGGTVDVDGSSGFHVAAQVPRS
ncbi:MAG: two-component sensor histidine kinase [Rhodococcus sp.]|nr:two-component sensor histidine kinase [Rhodococcus sp. (in: high G+C Gram-positive bacteria)]